MSTFDAEELAILRRLPARQAFDRVKDALYRQGGASSDAFLDVFEEMVELQILTPEQLEEYLG